MVVFCHGAFDFQENWFAYARQMNEVGWSAFTFDFAGNGRSEGSRSQVNLRIWTYNLRDALTTLQKRGYETFAVIGWGLGGSAILLAAAHDQRIESAVVLAAPMILQVSMAERVAYGLISGVAKMKQIMFKRSLNLSRLNELNEMRFLSDNAANEKYIADDRLRQIYAAVPVPDSLDSVWMDISTAVEKIHLPVLVIHSKEDAIIPADQGKKIHDLLKGPKELILIEGSGHALHLDKKRDEVFGLITNWINSNSQSS